MYEETTTTILSPTTRGGVKYQYLAALLVNIISISYGAFCGWPSSSFLELQAPDSPLETGPLTNQDVGWVASIVCFGGLFGTIFFSWLSEKVGRKRSILAIAVPSLIGWLMIPFARNPMQLCISRFIGGAAGGGTFGVIPIYIIELAQDSVRGLLGTMMLVTTNLGVLLVFVLGYYFDYATVAWIMSTFSLLFVACFAFMPETPQHYVQKHKIIKAEQSLRYYRNIRTRASIELADELQLELRKLRSSKKADELQAEMDDEVSWRDFVEPKARKALLIGICLLTFNQLSGCFAMLNYTAVIFKQAGSSLSPKVSAIIVGVIQLLGTYVSTLLVERAGRKPLLFISAVGTSVCQCIMASYIYLTTLGWETSAFQWVPIFGFSGMLFLACCGLLTMPFLVVSEILPLKIRSKANMYLLSYLWLLCTFMVKMLPDLNEALGMHGAIYVFSGLSMTAAVYVAIFVPETKGKTLEAIFASL